MEAPRARKLIESGVQSASRLATGKHDSSEAMHSAPVGDAIEQIVKPKSMVGGMRKLGVALVATPDPITGVPGVALLASSFVMKRREPASLGHLADETRKILRDVQSLRI